MIVRQSSGSEVSLADQGVSFFMWPRIGVPCVCESNLISAGSLGRTTLVDSCVHALNGVRNADDLLHLSVKVTRFLQLHDWVFLPRLRRIRGALRDFLGGDGIDGLPRVRSCPVVAGTVTDAVAHLVS